MKNTVICLKTETKIQIKKIHPNVSLFLKTSLIPQKQMKVNKTRTYDSFQYGGPDFKEYLRLDHLTEAYPNSTNVGAQF